MKNFFTSFFATLTALIVFVLGGFVVCFLFLAAFAAMGQKQPVTIQSGSYLVLNLSTNIQDTPSQTDGLEELAEIFGGNRGRMLQLREVTRSLQAAAMDSDIKGVYLTGSVQASDRKSVV